MAFEQSSDFDVFFYYGENQNPLEIENESDIYAGLTQRKRSMYYNRQFGAGIPDKENYPNSLALLIGTRYDVVNWAALRNNRVSTEDPDRRVAISQETVKIGQGNKKGTMDVNVTYIPFTNFEQPKSVSLPIGRGV